jgi:subfamily B ATP-binding cassette protein HlyB/CyaB
MAHTTSAGRAAGRLLRAVFLRYRTMWAEALGLSFATQLLTLLFPILMQVLIDRVLIARATGTFAVLVVAMLAVAILEGWFALMRSQLLEHTSMRVHTELGARIFQHLMSLPLLYFDRERMSDVIGRMRELSRLKRVLEGDSLARIVDFGLSMLLIALMAFYSGTLTVVLAGYLLVFCTVLAFTTPIFKRRLDQLFRSGAESDGLVVESLARIEAVKSTAIEPQIRARWETSLVQNARTHLSLRTATNWFTFVNHLCLRGGTILMLVVGGHLVLSGNLSIGEFFAFQYITLRLSVPMAFMIKSVQDSQESRVSIDKLSEILSAAPEGDAQNQPRYTPARIEGDLRLEGVSFGYHEGAPPCLREISLHIPAGQIVAFIGPSGSGKTTLVKLLLGLYAPTRGRVLLDDRDLSSFDARTVRRRVGFVQQDNPLFAMSVRDNIAIADSSLPLEAIQRAAILAGAHDFISRLPHGYDTLLGAGGSGLSGGERQRIAIARALASDPRIVVFDEATSALDFETEQILQDNMRGITADRTVIVVSHRLSAIRQCSRIVTLQIGSVIEDGTHTELMERDGWYAALYRLQSGWEPSRSVGPSYTGLKAYSSGER